MEEHLNKESKKQLAESIVVPRPPKDKSKVKDKNIKVSANIHHILGEIGKTTEDYGDVVERVLLFYLEKTGYFNSNKEDNNNSGRQRQQHD